ncbi:MAG: ABC transporter permease [Bacteroidetes bacterium]|nr:ABC transporter permease [Bacteroidota bacterium]
MLLKLAWRNIWRNKRRSLIVVTAVVIGLVSLIFTDSLSVGMIRQMLDNQIGSHISHIQIHKNGFNDNKIIQNCIPDYEKVETILQSDPSISHYSKRVVTYGLISSASNSSGISIIGIGPKEEENITIIKKSVVEGEYFSGKKRDIVIGKKLSEKLGVGIGDKIVLMVTNFSGNVATDVFRVAGLYETSFSEFDRVTAYIDIGIAQEFLGITGKISEFAIIVNNVEKVETIKETLAGRLGSSYEVMSYVDIIPAIILMVDSYDEMILVYYLIIGLATIFGIINVMLMSVFERVREFGVLMAMGMKNFKIFFMILSEALLLSSCGMIIGIIIGVGIYLPLSYSGINFSAFAEGLTMVGISAIVYPALTMQGVLNAIFIIPVISVVAAIYPAYRAISLQPVIAIRYV